MAAVPAPDGQPATSAWLASLYAVGYLTVWVGVGFCLAAFALRALG